MGSESCARPSKNVSSPDHLAGLAARVALALTAAQVVTPAELSRSMVVSHVDAPVHGGLGRARDAGTYERGAHPRQRVVPLPMACPSDDAAS
jgi:hypothetical protein